MYMTPFDLLSSGLLYGFRSSLCLWVDSSEFRTFSMSKKLSNNNMNVCVAAEPGILQNVMTPVLLQTFKWYSGFRVYGLDCLYCTLQSLICMWLLNWNCRGSPAIGIHLSSMVSILITWVIAVYNGQLGPETLKPLYQWIINYLQRNYIYIYIQTHYKIV